MKYNLHVHTSYSKKCGYTNPKNAIKAAIKSGLDGIAITDHDTIKGAIQAKEYSLGFFDVIIGSEITTNRGEIIGLFLSDLLSAGERKNPFNFSIDIDFLRTFGIKFKLKTFKC